MKKISIMAICALALVFAIAGCEKGVLDYGDVQKMTDKDALLKLNYASQYANNRMVFIKINDQRISSLITGRTPYPGGGYNTGGGNTADFLQVLAGDVKISVVLPRKINDGSDSIVLYSTVVKLEAGKKYVAHITDTATTTKTVITEEDFTRPDSSYARFHFINLMPNVPAIDLYYGATAATVADQSSDSLLIGNIAYLQNSPDFRLRYTGTNKIFKIRPAGAAKTAATLLAFYTTTSAPVNQRIFTAFATGYSGKTNTQKPYISFFLVR